jgi:hypothetical protein
MLECIFRDGQHTFIRSTVPDHRNWSLPKSDAESPSPSSSAIPAADSADITPEAATPGKLFSLATELIGAAGGESLSDGSGNAPSMDDWAGDGLLASVLGGAAGTTPIRQRTLVTTKANSTRSHTLHSSGRTEGSSATFVCTTRVHHLSTRLDMKHQSFTSSVILRFGKHAVA